MTISRKASVALIAALLAMGSTPNSAQVMAPGPALPGNLGGIGPGGTRVAPGGAANDSLIEQQGPGGVPLARGAAIEPSLHGPRHVHHHASRAYRTGARHRYQ
jgi:hypothetical protein